MASNPSSFDNVERNVDRMVHKHPQDMGTGERPSQYDTEAGSNYMAAKRDAEARGNAQEGLWGPTVHERDPKEVADEVALARGDRLTAENATGKPAGVSGGPEWESQEARASFITNVPSAYMPNAAHAGGHGHR